MEKDYQSLIDGRTNKLADDYLIELTGMLIDGLPEESMSIDVWGKLYPNSADKAYNKCLTEVKKSIRKTMGVL